jgi:KDO2-lipid IV(A) lauroyltransferase
VTAVGIRHRLEYGLVLAVRSVSRVLPDAASRAVGTTIGLLFYYLDAGHRRLATTQLHAAFPVRTEAECREIARRTFVHFGRLVAAVLKFSALDPAAMRARIEFEGDDRIRAALAGGKGVIIFSGHFGYWELQALGHALVLPPMSVMARPLDNPYLHRLLEDIRRRTGNGVIYRQGGLRRVLRALHANECVGMLIDQHVHGAAAVTVDFFGRPVATTSALATLALRTGAPLVPVFALPLQRGRYRLIYEHPVEPPPAGCADPVQVLTQRCTDVLEMYVRRHPHFWLWMHRRWRDHPATETGQTATVPGSLDESESLE